MFVFIVASRRPRVNKHNLRDACKRMRAKIAADCARALRLCVKDAKFLVCDGHDRMNATLFYANEYLSVKDVIRKL